MGEETVSAQLRMGWDSIVGRRHGCRRHQVLLAHYIITVLFLLCTVLSAISSYSRFNIQFLYDYIWGVFVTTVIGLRISLLEERSVNSRGFVRK